MTTGGEGVAKRTLQLMVDMNFSLRSTAEPSGGGRHVAWRREEEGWWRGRRGWEAGRGNEKVIVGYLKHIWQVTCILVYISILPVSAVGAHGPLERLYEGLHRHGDVKLQAAAGGSTRACARE